MSLPILSPPPNQWEATQRLVSAANNSIIEPPARMLFKRRQDVIDAHISASDPFEVNGIAAAVSLLCVDPPTHPHTGPTANQQTQTALLPSNQALFPCAQIKKHHL